MQIAVAETQNLFSSEEPGFLSELSEGQTMLTAVSQGLALLKASKQIPTVRRSVVGE